MKYKIGSIVILKDETQVYITGHESGKYIGFDVNNSEKVILFSESDVLLTV